MAFDPINSGSVILTSDPLYPALSSVRLKAAVSRTMGTSPDTSPLVFSVIGSRTTVEAAPINGASFVAWQDVLPTCLGSTSPACEFPQAKQNQVNAEFTGGPCTFYFPVNVGGPACSCEPIVHAAPAQPGEFADFTVCVTASCGGGGAV